MRDEDRAWREAQTRAVAARPAEPAAAPEMPADPDAIDAVLDALPEAILASFREEQERLRQETLAAAEDAAMPVEDAPRLAA
ncbi:hypothetical protein MET9862_05687 [Methylobacterium symbioticum]|uniref:Uncharacterized protein n=1 Tax=Methylobacterium symbioticum TaxID=2584084 RepID=A0A509ELJ4_9HYPH|nr:hypothetical protein MET9862_05687 [Methylobacterium symbioticum]